MATRRNAAGRFVKSKPGSGSTIIVSTPASKSPARRAPARSPYVVASRKTRRGTSGVPYSPVKTAGTGFGLGMVEKSLPGVFAKLPEVMGTKYAAVAAIAHVARGKLPGGGRIAETAAAIAGYQASMSGKFSLSVQGDEF